MEHQFREVMDGNTGDAGDMVVDGPEPFNPIINESTKKTRNTRSWKNLYKNLLKDHVDFSVRYESMKATAAVGYILALIEAIVISLLMFR